MFRISSEVLRIYISYLKSESIRYHHKFCRKSHLTNQLVHTGTKWLNTLILNRFSILTDSSSTCSNIHYNVKILNPMDCRYKSLAVLEILTPQHSGTQNTSTSVHYSCSIARWHMASQAEGQVGYDVLLPIFWTGSEW